MSSIDPKSFFPVEPFGEILEAAVLTMGLSGASVYSVKTTKGEFVLRVHGPDRETWEKSIILHALAADHGLAPPLIMIDKKRAATISPKIPGIAFGMAVAQPDSRPAAMSSMVSRLKALHAIPNVPINAKDPLEMGRKVWSEQSSRPGFPEWMKPFGKRFDALEKVLGNDQRKVFSHGDLNPANMLWDGSRVWFVDWEVAGLAHPYLDIATIATFLDLQDDAALGLLAAQEGKALDQSELEIFASMRQLVRIVYGAVFLGLVPDLTAVSFLPQQDALSLSQCYQLMGQGKLKMNEPQGQAQIAAAIMRLIH